uniref:PNPLA domain-containing protein n=1 Tax=Parastrongyloides trichosuri TaxID=131310 RepID=A0A0N5A0G5_PARTI
MLRIKNFPFFNKNKVKSFIGLSDTSEKILTTEKIEDNEDAKKDLSSDNTSTQINSNEPLKESTKAEFSNKDVEIVQPTYFGYLSGVLTSIWDQNAVSTNEKNVNTKQPLNKNGVTKSHARDVSPTKISKILIKRISRAEVVNLTKMHVDKLLIAQSTSSKLLRINALTKHIQEFRSSRMTAVSNPSLIPYLIKQVETGTDVRVKEDARKCLAILGHSFPLKSPGIRILSIDGGGTRGMMGLTILAAIEKAAGKKIYELYDHITGVSTGAILAVLLGVNKISVEDCKSSYMNISRRLFNQGKLSGVGGLLMSHSYYNTKLWIEILKEAIGENITCADSAKYENTPRLGIVSCIVNSPQLQPYIFRNYELPAGRDSLYRGGSQYYIWQAVQASAAAPTYFEEVRLGSVLLQDGGVLTNNPTAIAIHEAKNLWPNEDIQCVVSIGNGRSVIELELTTDGTKSTNLMKKMSKIIDSATDTEATHNCVNDLLPDGRYFRFNPYMSFPYTLDEIQIEKLDQMQRDADLYVRRNIKKIEDCAKQLTMKPHITKVLKRETITKLNEMGILKSDY